MVSIEFEGPGGEGKSGKGMLLLAPWEEYFLNEIHDLLVQKSQTPHMKSCNGRFECAHYNLYILLGLP